jgi:hypothetical protein
MKSLERIIRAAALGIPCLRLSWLLALGIAPALRAQVIFYGPHTRVVLPGEAFTLKVAVAGYANQGVTWTCDPPSYELEHVTGDCYRLTPPRPLETFQMVVLTARSVADPTVSDSVHIQVMPSNPVWKVIADVMNGEQERKPAAAEAEGPSSSGRKRKAGAVEDEPEAKRRKQEARAAAEAAAPAMAWLVPNDSAWSGLPYFPAGRFLPEAALPFARGGSPFGFNKDGHPLDSFTRMVGHGQPLTLDWLPSFFDVRGQQLSYQGLHGPVRLELGMGASTATIRPAFGIQDVWVDILTPTTGGFTHRISRKRLKVRGAGPVAGKPGAQSESRDGSPEEARIRAPLGVLCNGDDVVFTEEGSNDIRSFNATTGTVTTLSLLGGPEGRREEYRFNRPTFLEPELDEETRARPGRYFVADSGNHQICFVESDEVTTVLGDGHAGYRDGRGEEAQFSNPRGLAMDTRGRL